MSSRSGSRSSCIAEDGARKQEQLRIGHEILIRAVPGWRDTPTRMRLQAEMKEAAGKFYGYTPQELAGDILDPRQLMVLHDAMRYQQMQSRRVQPAPPEQQTPLERRRNGTAAPQPSRREADATAQFEQRPSVDNALALLKARRTQSRGPGRR